jgi:RHS repeat-associated protein
VRRAIEDSVQTWSETTTVSDTSYFILPQIQSFGYDGIGNLKVDTSTTGVVTSYVTDPFGRTTNVYDPVGTRTRHDYDPMNRVERVVRYRRKHAHPNGVDGLPASCNGTQTTCTDPHAGTPVPDPDTLPSSYTLGAQTLDAVTDPRGVGRSYLYDKRGLVRQETDDYGQSKHAYYDPAGLLTRVITRSGAEIRFYYDAVGRRSAMAFDDNNSYLTGCQGNLLCRIPGDSIRYTYDIMDNLLTVVSNNRNTITRSYYANGLLNQKIATYPVSPPATSNADTITYNYDGAGAVTRIAHGNDLTVYAYHPTTGDLQTMTVTLGAPGNTSRTFSFLLDTLGRRRTMTYPGSPAGPMTVKYRYDKAGLLRRVVVANPDAAPTNIFDGLKLKNTSVYPVGQIGAQHLVCPAGAQPGNPCGNIAGSSSLLSTGYAYNREGELIFRNRNDRIDRMNYDESGNMTYREDGVLLQASTLKIEASHNRLDSTLTSGLLPMKNWHDVNGSRVYERPDPNCDEDGCDNDFRERSYYYDNLGRISGTKTITPDGTRLNPNDCRYNAEGQLVAPCFSAPFLTFDGENVSGVLQAPNGTQWRNGWRFFHAPGVDNPLMGYFRSNTQQRILYFVTDGAGRQLAAADSSGTRQPADNGTGDQGKWTYAGAVQNGYGFDAERMSTPDLPSLSFFRNRVYDQASGRWLQEDPIGVAGGLNLYRYNGNNPVAYTDPFGLCPEGSVVCESIEAAATFAGGAAGFIGGGGLGLAEIAATGGLATPAGIATAAAGTVGGAAIGSQLGEAITSVMFRGGETGATKAGRTQHEEYYKAKGAEGYTTNKQIPGSRLRPDAIDPGKGIIRELKPNTPSGIRAGTSQLGRYLDAAQKAFGKVFQGVLDLY